MNTKLKINAIKNSLLKLKNSVKATLGPNGKTAIIYEKNQLKLVDDGITIIKALKFKENSEEHILELIREASLKTNEIVGDGTTTTVLLSCNLIEESIRLILAGTKSIFLATGLKKINNFIIQKLKEFSFPLAEPSQMISLLRTSIGNVPKNLIVQLKEAFLKKGKEGIILIEENYNPTKINKVELLEGLQIEQGFSSAYFVKNSSKFEVVLENSFILVTDKTISSFEQIREVLDYVRMNNQSLVLIAVEFEKSVLSTLIINNLNDKLNLVAIKAPYFGLKRKMVLEDISFVTNTNFIDEKLYKKDYIFSSNDLGRIKKATVTKNQTDLVLLQSSKLSLARKISELQREFKINDSLYEKEIIKYRINLLSGGLIKFYISASTNVELCQLRYKVEDGICSLNSAFQEGITISSNSLFLHLIEIISNWSIINLTHEEIFASKVFQKTLALPFRQLCENTNLNYPLILDKTNEKGYPFGFDFAKKELVDLEKEGILDSSKMIRIIFQNSISIAISLLLAF
jgi:chaperonin GroEL